MRAPTPQQIYNRTVEHLHTQGKQAVRNSMCAYRGPRHTMCAVGCHIPDELYSITMEGKPLDELFRNYPDVRRAIVGEDPLDKRRDLLDSLQDAHDSDEHWPDPNGKNRKARLILRMTDTLRAIARNHGLSAAVLKTLGY